MQQLKSGFKPTVNSNEYQPKTSTQASNRYLNYLIDSKFWGVNRIFVLTFCFNGNRLGHFFDPPIRNDIKAYENLHIITISQGDDYRTGSMLDYNYFNKYYKMIAIDLSKQQAFDANPEAIQQLNFTGNLGGANNRVRFFITEEIFLIFHKDFWKCCSFIFLFFIFLNIISI